jgi:hypothetical protein
MINSGIRASLAKHLHKASLDLKLPSKRNTRKQFAQLLTKVEHQKRRKENKTVTKMNWQKSFSRLMTISVVQNVWKIIMAQI